MKLRQIAVVMTLASIAASECAGALVGFYFSGFITTVHPGSDPFQAGLKPLMPVSGHGLYDPDSLPTDPMDGCVCMGYRQSITGGFSATFGSTFFQADDYIVQVENIHDKDLGDYDQLVIGFAGNLNPQLASPLYVNGDPYPNSLLQVFLVGASDTFDDSSLPKSLNLALFNSEYNLLEENAGHFSVLWKNTSLKSFTAGGGDYDQNGTVNNDDYAVWRSSFGSTTSFDADGNGNGLIDAADYVIWREHNGQLTSPASVPEPTCGMLIVMSLGALASHRLRMD